MSRCAIVSLLAGVKALKKKGLARRPINMSYANAYGMPPTGFAFGAADEDFFDVLELLAQRAQRARSPQ